jgi:hypothetical protein
MKKYSDRLDEDEVKEKIGEMFRDVHLERNSYNKYYYAGFLLRRLVFILIPLVSSKITIQAQLLFILNVMYILAYGGFKPHKLKTRYWIEMLNEFTNFILCYHLLCFSKLVSFETQYTMGYSYLCFIGFAVAVNFTYMFINNYFKYRTIKRK